MNQTLIKKPLKLGGMLDQVSRLVERLFARGVLYSLLASLPGLIAVVISAQVVPSIEDPMLRNLIAGLIAIPAAVLGGLFQLLGAGVLMKATSDICMGRPLDWKSAQRKVKSLWLQLVITCLILGLWTTLGFFCLIIPGILILLNAAVLYPAMLTEETDRKESWQRSKDLMRGHRLRYFGYSTILVLLTMVVGAVLGALGVLVLGTLTGPNSIGKEMVELVGHAITFTWYPVFNTLFYFDLRVRKEAADLELASQTINLCPA